MASKTAITPHLLNTLPGQFAIRTRVEGSFITARGFGGTEVDALITPGQIVEATEHFTLAGYLTPPTNIQTADGHYVIAFGGGGMGAGPNDGLTFSTFDTALPDNNWGLFQIKGPDSNGMFTITTLTNNYVTAVGGGGKSTQAFHTDATTASGWEQFYITKLGDLGSGYYYALRPVFPTYTGNNPQNYGRYLSATSGGGLTTGNAIEVVYGLGITTAFKLTKFSAAGDFTLMTSNGVNYVTAAQGGGLAHGSSADGILHTDNKSPSTWETFAIIDLADGTYAIKTFSGFLIGVDEGGDISTRISDVNAAPTIGYTARFELVMLNPVY